MPFNYVTCSEPWMELALILLVLKGSLVVEQGVLEPLSAISRESPL